MTPAVPPAPRSASVRTSRPGHTGGRPPELVERAPACSRRATARAVDAEARRPAARVTSWCWRGGHGRHPGVEVVGRGHGDGVCAGRRAARKSVTGAARIRRAGDQRSAGAERSEQAFGGIGSAAVPPFQVVSDFEPAGDQPQAIAQLAEGIERGDRFQTLLGITGSRQERHHRLDHRAGAAAHAGAGAQQEPGRPAGQRVPGVLPRTTGSSTSSATTTTTSPRPTSRRATPTSRRTARSTTRSTGCATAATAALLTRRDVIVVASVSCIYGMGNPEEYRGQLLELHTGVDYDQRSILRQLVDLQYDRNDMTLGRGKFRVRGDTIEVHPAYDETVLRIEMFGDTVERLTDRRPAHRRAAATSSPRSSSSRPPTTSPATSAWRGPSSGIEAELQERLACFETRGQAARGPAAAHAHPVRPGDDPGGRLLQRHRELLDAHRRPRPRRAAVHPARLLPEGLPARHRREPPGRARSCTASTRATAAARTCSSSTASACPAPGDNRPLRFEEVMERINQVRVPVGHAGRLRAAGVAARSSSRSCGPPAWSTPRSS